MSRHWHRLARGLQKRGLKPRDIAEVFGVTDAAVHMALKRLDRRLAAPPAWLPPRLEADFTQVASELGPRAAEAWARAETGRGGA